MLNFISCNVLTQIQLEIKRKYMKVLRNKEITYEAAVVKVLILSLKLRSCS